MNKESKAIDMTRGNILRCMLLFILPVLAGNLLQELYSLVDTMIVGRTLGVVKLAAVGITGSLSFFATGFIIGNAGGCSVLSSQRFGAGDQEGLERSIAAHYTISLVEAVVLTLLFTSLSKTMLKLMNTGSDMLEHSFRYLIIIYAGLPATILYNLLSTTLRAVGDSRTPLLFLAVSSLLNIVLDLLFILGFHWDVRGAAIATVVSQLISGVSCLFYTRKKFPNLIPRRSAFRKIGPEIHAALKAGVPMGLTLCVSAAGGIILAGVLNRFGSSAVAAHTMCSKIVRLIETPMHAVSTMVATLVGQNYGARRYDRIHKGVRQISLLSFSYLIVFSTLAYVLRRLLIRIFIGNMTDEVMYFVEQYMRWVCPFMCMVGFLLIYRGASVGLGDGSAALIASISELIARGAVTPLLAPLLGFTAVCITGPLAWVFCSLLGFFLFTTRLRKFQQDYPQTDFSER